MAARRTSGAERAQRMLALLRHLRPDQPISLGVLAQAVGTSQAELASDLEILSMCGVWPYTPDAMLDVWLEEDGLVHTYSEPPALDRPLRLSVSEARALATALRACGFTPHDPLLAKVADVASDLFDADELAGAVRAAVEPGGVAAVYRLVATALAEHESLRAAYYSAGRETRTERTIRPYALANDRGHWYVSAYCESAQAVRTFRLDRFVEVRRTGLHFEPPERPLAPTPAFLAEGLPLADVRFEPGEDVSARDWPGATFETAVDGAVLASVPFSSPEWIARRVAARLGRAEVLAPAEVRRAVTRIARRTAEAHQAR